MKNETTPALSFRNVSKLYSTPAGQQLAALDGVSFSVREGQVIAIVGRSGSGKSTLLHLAAGIDLPSKGDIFVEGKSLDRLNEGQRTRLRRDQVGLVFQFFYLLPHLSVRENVALPEMIAGGRRRDYEERLEYLLERVGLRDRGDETAEKLSGGEMQRIAICRSLVRSPSIVLADEPTGNLDDENARSVMDLMLQLVEEEGSTLIYVTHSREMAGLAEEIWTLHSGTLEHRG